MGRWISRYGIMKPAHEHVVLPHLTGKFDKDGKPLEVYDGPDRSASQYLHEHNVDHLGQDFRLDPEVVMRAKQFGYNSVEEYARAMGWDPEKEEAAFSKHEGQVHRHEPPVRTKRQEQPTGGKDTSGQGRDMKGGFGKQPDVM